MTPDQSLAHALEERVVLVPYDPRWPKLFAEERDRLLARLGSRLVEIRHFGSTAVPGLAAKPVIDLIAGVGSMDEADALLPELRGLGYHYPGAANAGIPNRRWLFMHHEGHRTHQLHLVEHDGAAWRDRVGFCERLKADAGLRARYGALKQALAARFAADRDDYNAHKQAFILSAIGAARKPPSPGWLPYPIA